MADPEMTDPAKQRRGAVPKDGSSPGGSAPDEFAAILEEMGGSSAYTSGDTRSDPILGGINQATNLGNSLLGQNPAYRATDVNMPVGKPPEDIARLQQALIAAGLLRSNNMVAAGAWGQSERTAFKKLLTFANLNGITWQEALQVYSDSAARGMATGQGYGSSMGGPEEPQFQAQVTNPDDLRLALKDASAALRAGGGFDEATIERLVQVYQAAEVEDQRAAFAQEAFGQTVTAPRSAETILRETVKDEDPAGYTARQVADRAQEFFGMLTAPVGPTKL